MTFTSFGGKINDRCRSQVVAKENQEHLLTNCDAYYKRPGNNIVSREHLASLGAFQTLVIIKWIGLYEVQRPIPKSTRWVSRIDFIGRSANDVYILHRAIEAKSIIEEPKV